MSVPDWPKTAEELREALLAWQTSEPLADAVDFCVDFLKNEQVDEDWLAGQFDLWTLEEVENYHAEQVTKGMRHGVLAEILAWGVKAGADPQELRWIFEREGWSEQAEHVRDVQLNTMPGGNTRR